MPMTYQKVIQHYPYAPSDMTRVSRFKTSNPQNCMNARPFLLIWNKKCNLYLVDISALIKSVDRQSTLETTNTLEKSK